MAFKLNIEAPSDVQSQVRDAARARRVALGLTQENLAARSGVPLATLKLFEQKGQISLKNLLVIADALDALPGFGALFPPIEASRLQDLRQRTPRQRVRGRRNL